MRYLPWAIAALVAFGTAACSGAPPAASPTSAPAPASAEPSPSPAGTTPPPEAASDAAAATEPPAGASDKPAAGGSLDGSAGTDVVQAWYVRAGSQNVFVEPERRTLASATVGVAKAALKETIEGTPRDPGLRTLAPEGTRVLGVNRRDAVIIVDVSDDVDRTGAGSAEETAFAQQLAHTVTQFDGVRSVRLLVEGERVTDLWGHLDWSRPIRPDEFAISPIIVSSPRHGQTVAAGTVTARGTANTFEATVELTLRDPDGDVVKRTFTTATCGSGCRGEWKRAFRDVTQPGRWALIATAPDASDGEGPPPFRTRRVFTVR